MFCQLNQQGGKPVLTVHLTVPNIVDSSVYNAQIGAQQQRRKIAAKYSADRVDLSPCAPRAVSSGGTRYGQRQRLGHNRMAEIELMFSSWITPTFLPFLFHTSLTLSLIHI